MKTNREKNQEYVAQKQQERVRPKEPNWVWQPLDEVVRQWAKCSDRATG